MVESSVYSFAMDESSVYLSVMFAVHIKIIGLKLNLNPTQGKIKNADLVAGTNQFQKTATSHVLRKTLQRSNKVKAI